MCINCSSTKKKYWVFGCGTFFLLLALVTGLLWPTLATYILQNDLQLKEGSLNYNNWIETPLPMYLKITMFNWTNPEAIHNKNIKPHFNEVGPYVFLEKHKRVNITWHAENGTVSFNQTRTWHFIPELSNGSLTDEITSVNVMAASTAYNVRHSNVLMRFAANELINLKGSLTVTKTADEWLFTGYKDPLLDFLKELKLSKFQIPFSKFGWFVDRNESSTYDGNFEMFTGQNDLSKMGYMTDWNYGNKTKYYYDECSKVRGTSGELWPVHMNATGDITMYITDVCRSLTLGYDQQHTKYGVTGSRWVGDYRMFDNGVKYPSNKCYCTGVPSSCPDLLSGVHNMSDCRYGAPAFASFPHFYLADPAYVNAVDGLKPNRSLHEFSLSLEPQTGIPLEIDAKLQINILLQPIPTIKLYKNVPKVMIPTFWFEQTLELDEKLASKAKMAMQLPSIGVYTAYGISSLGLILVLVGIVVTLTKSWQLDYEQFDDELNS